MVSEDRQNKTLHEFRPTWAAWFWPLVLTIGMAFPLIWWRRRGIRYIVRSDRVIRRRGHLSAKTDEFQLEDVTRLQTERSIGERLLGSGTIILDTGVDELKISGVPDHESVVASIREAQ
jgi:hypothetical protein